jgi:hypothetical protein
MSELLIPALHQKELCSHADIKETGMADMYDMKLLKSGATPGAAGEVWFIVLLAFY